MTLSRKLHGPILPGQSAIFDVERMKMLVTDWAHWAQVLREGPKRSVPTIGADFVAFLPGFATFVGKHVPGVEDPLLLLFEESVSAKRVS